MSAEGTDDGLKGKSLTHHLVRGSAWMIGMRLGVRLIGFVSTMILARLLVPEDFGIIAMAMIIVAFLKTFLDTGFELAVIRHPNPEKDHYDTAFTVTVIVGAASCLVLNALAPLAAEWFQDERVRPLMHLLSLVPLIVAFQNIGVLDFQRDLDFHRDFQFYTLAKVISAGIGIALAFWLRSYWALAIVILVGQVTQVALSYVMHPHRPRLTLSKFGELRSMSFWLMAQALARTAQQNVDRLMLGRTSDAATLGKYSVMAEFTHLVLGELILPIQRALFPVLSKIQDEQDRLRDSFPKVLVATAYCALPLGVGLAMTAEETVAVIYGQQWLAGAPFMFWIALAVIPDILAFNSTTVLNAMGRMGLSGGLFVLRFVATAVVVTVLAFTAGPLAVVKGLLAVNLTMLLISYGVGAQVIGVSPLLLVLAHLRPLAAVGFMAVGLAFVPSLDFLPAFFALFLKIGLGAVLFGSAALGLWIASGRPRGVEAELFDKLGHLALGLRRRALGAD